MGLVSNLPSMAKWIGVLATLMVSLQLLSCRGVEGKSILPQGSLDDGGKPGAFIPEMDLGGGSDDDAGNMEASLLNYLYTKQMLLQRLKNQMSDLTDPVKKRNYWKQCAFNAVSCFG